VDAAGKRLYVGRSTHTQVIDTQSGKVVGDIKDTPGVHAVALAPDVNRGFTSNGRGNSVGIFDLKTLEPIGIVEAGQNPDAIIYDPASKTVIAFNGRSNDATVIDAEAAPGSKARATLELGGKPEFAASDGQGHVYVNIEDKSEVAVIDTKTWKVSDHWKIEGGEEPSGLALDASKHRLYLGCGGNNVMAVMDATTGKTLTTLPIGKGVDGCDFDPGNRLAFASCGDGTMTVIGETSPGKFEVVQKAMTRRGARTMTLDPATQMIYLPTAEFEAPTTGATRPGRPNAKPNTFMIVVVAPHAP
jgi:DNA-binding beta-propeller fold protein YncE